MGGRCGAVAALLCGLGLGAAAEPNAPRLVVQTGHAADARAAAFSPDGALLATAGADRRVLVRDARTGVLVRTLSARFPLNSVAFTADGRFVLARGSDVVAPGVGASYETSHQAWDAATGDEVRPGGKGEGHVVGAAVAGGVRACVAREAKNDRLALEVWDGARRAAVLDGTWPGTLSGLNGATGAPPAVLAPGGRRVAVGGPKLQVFDAGTGKLGFDSGDVPGPLADVAFSADGALVAAVNGTELLVWAADGKVRHRFAAKGAFGPAFAPDGASVSARLPFGGRVTWALGDGARTEQALPGPFRAFGPITSPAGDRYAGLDGAAVTVVPLDGGPVVRVAPSDGPVGFVSVSRDGATVAHTIGRGRLAVWDAVTGRLKGAFGPFAGLMGVAVSPDGAAVVAVGRFGVRSIDLTTGRERWATRGPVRGHAAFRPDGAVVAVGHGGGADLHDAVTGKVLKSFRHQNGYFTALAFAPDGKTLACGWLRSLVLWDADEGKKRHTLYTGFYQNVESVAFSPDGALVAAGLTNHTGGAWDAATGKFRFALPLESNEPWAVSVAFAPGGELVSGGHDGLIRWWDAGTGKQRRSASGNSRELFTGMPPMPVAFAPGGKAFYAGRDDGALDVRRASDGAPLVTLRASGRSWVAAAPDGRFDTNDPDAVPGVRLVMPDEPFRPLSPDVFLRDYYEPKLFARVLAGEVLPPVRSLASLNRVQPSVKVTSVSARGGAADEVDVTVEVAARARPLERVGAAPVPKEPAPAARPQLVTQLRHAQQIVAVAVSADGRLALTSSEDQTVRLWDAESGKLLRIYRGSSLLVPVARALAFAPDGRRFLVGGFDGRVTVFDVATGREVSVYKGGDQFITSAAFASDGRSVVTTWLLDKSVRRIDPATGQEVLRLKLNGEPTAAALSPDGSRLLTAERGAVRLWDAGTGRELDSFNVGATALAFSADGARFLTGGGLTTAVWDAGTGRQLAVFRAPQGNDDVSAVGFVPGGVFVGGITCRLWDVTTGKELRVLNPKGEAASAALSADGRRLVTSDIGAGRFVARVWTADTGTELRTLTGDTDWAYFAAFAPDGKSLLTGGARGAARLWDTGTGRERAVLRGHQGPIRAAAFSPDGTRALTGGFDATARLWDAATGKELLALKGHAGTVSAVAFAADGKRLATGSWDGTIRIWDAGTGRELTSFAEPPGQAVLRRVGSAAFSADGKTVLTSSWGAAARLWDVATGKELKTYKGHRDVVVSARFSPDEKTIVTSSGDGTARIWDVGTGGEVRTLAGHLGGLPAADFSADGTQVLTGGVDGTARLWDAAGGREVRRFVGHDDFVNAAQFSPDGRHIVTAGSDGSVRLWNPATGAEVCRLVGFQGGGWAVVAPDGRFDTNDLDAVAGLHWMVPDEPLRPLSPEVFMRDYYEPRLLARVLAGEKLPPVRSLADLNRVQPAVKVAKVVARENAPDEADVTVEVAARARALDRAAVPTLVESGAFDLHLFRDGQLVALKDGKLDLDPKTGRAVVTFERVKLPRTAGKKDVEFSAYAFNADRVKSDTAKLAHALPANLPARKGTAYIVCVGVNAFDERKWDLRFAAPDAKLMAKSLGDALTKGGQYEKVVAIALLSEPRLDKDGFRVGVDSTATKENLRQVLAALAGRKPDPGLVKAVPGAADLREARPEDAVVLTFSTHGYGGADGRFYLFPSDIGVGHGGAVTDELLKRAVSSDELAAWLRGVDAGELVAVVDACQSAGSVEADGFKPGPMGSRGLGQLAYNKRMRVLAASQADDVALEDARIGHGLLTFALCKDGLGSGLADFEPKDGRVTVGEWLRYGVRRVPLVAEEIASGKNAAARAPVRVSGKPQKVAQQPSLFDFTKRPDELTLTPEAKR